jgi:hypothetical protein
MSILCYLYYIIDNIVVSTGFNSFETMHLCTDLFYIQWLLAPLDLWNWK